MGNSENNEWQWNKLVDIINEVKWEEVDDGASWYDE